MNALTFTRRTPARLTLGLIALLFFHYLHQTAQAQTYYEHPVYNFKGGTNDGEGPNTLLNVNGILYGTTGSGGTQGYGTIFSFDPATNTETTLYSFLAASSNDGFSPNGDLILVNGKLYGTTYLGGTNDKGTVFSFDPAAKTETVLHSFAGNPNDGANPYAGLLNENGILYGTTFVGGSGNAGTIFAIDPTSKIETTLYSFQGNADGLGPVAGLLDVNGKLFGTTAEGGSFKEGTIFSFDPATNTEAILHNFGASSDIGGPNASLVNVNGTLYGTAYGGGQFGGTIFSFDPVSGIEHVLHSFPVNTTDGANPRASLFEFNGRLFGTTVFGGVGSKGDYSGNGIVFSIDPVSTNYSIVRMFQGGASDGTSSVSSLIEVNGILYGTTVGGGTSGSGTIFTLTPAMAPIAINDAYTVKYNTEATINSPGVLTNDNPEANETPTAALVSTTTHGSLTFNADGSFTYMPSNGFVGTDSFTYKETNSFGTSNTATVALAIQTTVPTAKNDNGRTAYNTTLNIPAPGVLTNDFNGDTSTMTAILVTNPSHGTITFHSNGSFQYIPYTGYLGTDSFTYQAVNALGDSNTATCTLLVQARTPIAYNDNGRTYYNTTLVIGAPGVLGNDYNGDTGPMTAALVINPSHGTITFKSDGSFTYTPTSGFIGTDNFTYQDTNALGISNTATCTLLVQARTPIANNDAGRVTHNTTATFSAPGVLGNDNAGDTGTITTTLVTGPSHGTITFHTDGSFVYTPTIGFVGTDSFTYKDTNAVGTSNTATCTLTVQ